jgi:hypothetical protein
MRKTLRNNQEVAHVWASQSQSEGKCGNMFFEGPSIFSYGHHFEIARIVKPGVVLFNDRSYSNSTSKHQNYTYQAVSHMKGYTVPSMTDHNMNVDAYMTSILNIVERIKRARSGFKWHFNSLKHYQEKLLSYLEQFPNISSKRAIKAKIIAKKVFFTVTDLKKFKEKEDRNAEAQTKAHETRKHNQEIYFKNRSRVENENEAHIQALMEVAYRVWESVIADDTRTAWLSGDDQAQMPYDGSVLLRLIKNETEIETSQGAYVPVSEAKALWYDMQNKIDIKNRRIGSYTISGIHDGKLIIGCHCIPLREVARMAVMLGLNGN